MQPLHPHLVGLPSLPPGRAPCRKTGKPRGADNYAPNHLKPSVKPFYYVSPSRFYYVVAGRLPCRPLRAQLTFVSWPNRGASRVDRDPTDEPNRPVAGRLACRPEPDHYVVFTVWITQRPRGLMDE
ncbi:hypothetical protein, partial [Spirosoma daeguense]